MTDVISKIEKYETLFSDNQYNGSGSEAFQIEEGTIPIMVSAPHAVNHFRAGREKWADMYTGGIARYLHEKTGCHLIYSCMFTESDPNYDEPGKNQYQDALSEYVKEKKIRMVLDLHGAAKKREYALEMGTAPKQNLDSGEIYEQDPSLHEYKFVADKIKNIFEDLFTDASVEQKAIWKNQIFDAGDQNTVTKYISENTETACIQLEINGNYRDPENAAEMEKLVKGLECIIDYLANL